MTKTLLKQLVPNISHTFVPCQYLDSSWERCFTIRHITLLLETAKSLHQAISLWHLISFISWALALRSELVLVRFCVISLSQSSNDLPRKAQKRYVNMRMVFYVVSEPSVVRFWYRLVEHSWHCQITKYARNYWTCANFAVPLKAVACVDLLLPYLACFISGIATSCCLELVFCFNKNKSQNRTMQKHRPPA